MRLSIITIAYCNINGLKRTAESIISQTFQDFEWIVVDGGSHDGSKEFLESISDKVSWWCSEPDHGIYNAMNKGVQHASGDYCLFLNSGDWLVNNTSLERVFNLNLSCDILYGDIKTYLNGQFEKDAQYSDNLLFEDLVNKSIAHPATFIRRPLLVDTPYNEDLRIVSDWEFFIRMALKNKSFVHIPFAVSCFDLSGISSSDPKTHKVERERVKNELLPTTIYNGCNYVKEIEHDLDRGLTRELIKLRKSHRLFSKLITFEVMIMNKLDKII